MKKSLIASLLLFSVTCSSNICFASDDFDYGISKEDNVNFNSNVRYEDSSGALLLHMILYLYLIGL